MVVRYISCHLYALCAVPRNESIKEAQLKAIGRSFMADIGCLFTVCLVEAWGARCSTVK